jgi:ribose-phosphate pyrophosphokinase
MNTPQKKYNIMLVWTPDTEKRVAAVRTRLMENLGEEVESEIIPFKKFADGSWNTWTENSVRGKHVYIYVDHFSDYAEGDMKPDLDSRYMLGMHIRDQIIRSDAKTVNLIYPKTPYARSDKETDMGVDQYTKRQPRMAFKVMKDIKDDFIDRYITVDIHNPAVISVLDGRPSHGINLGYGWLIKKALHDIWGGDLSNIEIGSTDLGGAKKIDSVSTALKINNFVGDKTRDKTIPNSVAKIRIHKNEAIITDKDIVVYDDMIDTGGTLEKLTEKLWDEHPRSTNLVITHGLFNKNAWELLDSLHERGKLQTLYITDSVYRILEFPSYVKVIPTDEIIAQTITSIAKNRPVQYNYTGDDDLHAADL